MKLLFFADIVGRSGRQALLNSLPKLREQYPADFVLANAENVSGGIGVKPAQLRELSKLGIDLFTSGNHIWQHADIIPFLRAEPTNILRPINYPSGSPGAGVRIIESSSGQRLAVINAMGRIFMDQLLDCPFRAIERELERVQTEASCIFVDFHAEATSEKQAMAYFLNGRVSAIVGTHTHVQTADERILDKGTAYITDVGMCGAKKSVIGFEVKPVTKRFYSGLPSRFKVASGPAILNAVYISINPDGKASEIQRISIDGYD